MTQGPIARSLILLFAALVGVAVLLADPLVATAKRFNGEAAASAAVTYAALKVITAAFSVARDADVEGGVVAASVTVSPGQALTPVASTLERMADLLFGLILTSTVVGFVLPYVSQVGALALIVGGVGLALLPMAGRALQPLMRSPLRTVLLLGLHGSLVVPGAYALAFFAGERMTDQAWSDAAAIFQSAEATAELPAPQANAAPAPPPTSDPGTASFIENLWNAVTGALAGSAATVSNAGAAVADVFGNVAGAVANTTEITSFGLQRADQLLEASVQLGGAYLVRLIVLPALTILAAMWLVGQLRRGPRSP